MGPIQQSINQALSTTASMGALYKGLLEDKIKTQMKQKEEAKARKAKEKAEAEAIKEGLLARKEEKEISSIQPTNKELETGLKAGLTKREVQEAAYAREHQDPESLQLLREQAEMGLLGESQDYGKSLDEFLSRPNTEAYMKVDLKNAQRKNLNNKIQTAKRRAGGIK